MKHSIYCAKFGMSSSGNDVTYYVIIRNELRGFNSASDLQRLGGRRSSVKFVPTYAGRGSVAWSALLVPTAVILRFLDVSRNFSFKLLLNFPHGAEWTPLQTYYFSGNLVALGIEAATSGS
jgi:hypothetical protein